MTDDATLLRQFATTHEEDAFAELVRRHIDAVYSAALRRVAGDTHLAKDITQQVFIALARKAQPLASHPNLLGWLHTSTRHQAAHAVRSEQRRRAREQQFDALQTSAIATSSASPAWAQIATVVDSLIDKLNDSDRAAILLRFFEKKSFNEIGASLRTTEDAARMRVDRALEKLRRLLAARGIHSTTAALGLTLTHHAVAAAPPGLAAGVTTAASLATASTAAGGTAFVSLMTASKLTTGIAAAVLLVAGLGTSTYQFARYRSVESALAATRDRHAAGTARLRSLNEQAHALTQEIARLDDQLATAAPTSAHAPSASAGSASTATTATAPWDPEKEGRAFLERHPAVQQALIDWATAAINFQFIKFYELAGLTAAEIAEFQTLLRAGHALGRNIGPEMKDVMLTVGSPAEAAQRDSRLRKLLGPERYENYLEYRQTLPTRELVARFAGALAFTDTPLTADQSEHIIQSFVSKRVATPTKDAGPRYDWSTIVEEARVSLAPEQLAILNDVRAQLDHEQAYSQAFADLTRTESKTAQSSP